LAQKQQPAGMVNKFCLFSAATRTVHNSVG